MMNKTGFDLPGGAMALSGAEKFCGVFPRLHHAIASLAGALRGTIAAPGALLVLLALPLVSAMTPASAQTVTCTGGPLIGTDVGAIYSAVANTCTMNTNIAGASSEAGAHTFRLMNVAVTSPSATALRGLGAGYIAGGHGFCDFGDGGGDLAPGGCRIIALTDATDLVGTFEWDSANPGAPVTSDRRMVVNYRRDGLNYTIQSAFVTVIGVAAPEINVTGNGNTIADGDTTPTGTDHTLFGNVDVHSGSIERTFTIQNTGTGTLTLGANAVTLSSSGSTAGEFTITQQPATSVAAAGSTTFKVLYDPADFADDTVTVNIANNDGDENPYNFDITGAPIAVDINLKGNSASIGSGDTTPDAADHTDFGSADVTTGTVTRTFTIENLSGGTLVFGANAVSLTGSSDFTVTTQPPTTLATAPFFGATTTFQITFDPSSAGLKSATVSLANNVPGKNPYTFAIQGTGAAATPEIAVTGNGVDIADGDTTPDTADDTDFGSADVTAGMVSHTFIITNSGTAALNLGANAASLSGANAGDFSITSQPATTVAEAASTTVVVQFDPTVAGLRTATLSIANDDTDETPFDFVIQGTGSGAPEISISSSESGAVADGGTDTFASIPAAGSATSVTYTITNTGTSPLMLSAPTVDANISGASNVTVNNLVLGSTNVAAGGGSTTLVVDYTPTAAGAFGFALSIANDDVDENPYDITASGTASGAPEISLTGNGTDISDGDTSPDVADDTEFGSADITTDTVSRTFTITNTGTGILNLGSNAASLSGADAGDFSITAQPATTVPAAGSSTSVTVEFNPAALGTRTATLSIANDDADEAPFDFAVGGTGTGVPGEITIVLSVTGPDTDLGFTSATPALNFSLSTSGGSAQATLTGVLPGTHTITAANLATSGYVVTAIACSDSDSMTDAKTRTATVKLGSGENVTCTFSLTGSDGVTSQMIVDYLGARNNFILSNQADRTRRIDRLRGAHQGLGDTGPSLGGVSVMGIATPFASPVSASLSKSELTYSARASQIFGYLGHNGDGMNLPELGGWEFWSEGRVSLYDDKTSQSGKFGILHFGTDYLLSPNLLVGAKLQIDWMDQRFATTSGKIAGTGYMVGPYATIALDDHFFLDMAGSLGRSSNRISPFGTYTDRFSTTRWMLDAALVGQFEIDNWTIQPTLAAKYISEHQAAYTNSVGFPIAAQTVAQGEISFSPRLSYEMELDDDTMLIPWAEVTGRYGMQAVGSPSAGSFASQLNGLTASLSAGIDVALPGGASLALSGNLDGIGVAAESYGIRFVLSVPLN